MQLLDRWAYLCLLIVSCNSVQAGNANDYQHLVQQAALSSGVPAALIQSVIRVESSFREDVVSPKGAQGLMQLMPATAQRFGVKRAFDPEQNIRGGTQYLRWLYQRYQNWPLALAAYNAGEQKVDKYDGMPPYRETRNYVRKVLRHYAKLAGKPVPIESSGQGRVVPAVLRSVSNSQQSTLNARPDSRNLDAEARASSVFFTE